MITTSYALRRRIRAAGVLLLVFGGWCSPSARGASLCVETADPCIVAGSAVPAQVIMDPGDLTITGGQFSLTFDVASFDLISVRAGHACDATSPFQQVLLLNVDKGTGEIFFAVSVLPGDPGATAPEVMACLVFEAKANQSGGDLCVITDTGSSFLVDDAGQAVPLDNSIACPSTGKPFESCTNVEFGATCTCVNGVPDCSPVAAECLQGVCVEMGGARCVAVSAPNGTTCDDGFDCTSDDVCTGGTCLGTGCENPSVCFTSEAGCNVPGGTVVRAVLGAGNVTIAGAQINIEYDPTVMQLLGIAPGQACDPSSPFETELVKELDAKAGSVFYAVGVDFLHGGTGTQGPATLACLTFAPSGSGAHEVCLTEGINPQTTILTNQFGQPVSVFNAIDCPSDQPGTLACMDVTFDPECACVPDTEDCAAFDTECLMGFCDALTHRCRTQPVNNGGACDDGSDCTSADRCIQGQCRGFFCDDPSLCVVGPGCVGPGLVRPVEIRLGEGDPVIVGGQFALSYDPSVLQFVDAVAGADCDITSPFTNALFLSVDENAGEVFFAVSIDPTGHGTNGPAVMACLQFVALVRNPGDICVLEGANPFRTLLVDQDGNSITAFNELDCPADAGPPVVTCDEICTIPTVSHWGLISLAMLLLAGGKILCVAGRSTGRYGA
ncbi:MAG: cohesin domain-containing protein [Phycisphaerae bacterium]